MMRVFAVFLVAVCLSLTAVGQGPPRGTTSPSVIDAQGRFVGEVIGTRFDNARSYGLVRFEFADGDTAIVPIGRVNGALTWVREADLYFETKNCTGTPLRTPRHEEFTERVSAVLDGSTLYVSDGDQPPEQIRPFSVLRELGTCEEGTFFSAPFIALRTQVDLSSAFTHPFRLVESRSRPVR